jgi:hypothetical protein
MIRRRFTVSSRTTHWNLERKNSDDARHPLYRSTTKHITWEVRHNTGDRSLGEYRRSRTAREGAAHKTPDHGGARITEARRFVPGPNSGIDSVPRSMDNRSRRPVDFRYMASARKHSLIDIAMSAMSTELLDSKTPYRADIE